MSRYKGYIAENDCEEEGKTDEEKCGTDEGEHEAGEEERETDDEGINHLTPQKNKAVHNR